ncbi:thiazole tautomerase TenI [Priestia megaterium]|nr:thiazole tautomerase TenI [Priestia megaterium]
MKKIPKFHVISTNQQSVDQLSRIIKEISPYIDVIHIREKSKTAKEIQCLLQKIEGQVAYEKVIVNDRIDIAYAFNLRGVQLAYHSLDVNIVQRMFPSLLIGKSVHSVIEAKTAEEEGADYVICGHVYPSQSKPDKQHKGLQGLKEVVDCVNIPVIAIGGVTPGNTEEILKTGAYGIAVMSGIFNNEEPVEAAKQYHHLVTNGGGKDESTL